MVEEGDFRRIQSLISQDETFIGENEGHRLLELHSLGHLEEESKFTGHCIGNSEHYIRKINDGIIRIFSLRLGNDRVTFEYHNKRHTFLQMQGKDSRQITLSELDIALKIFASNDNAMQGVGFNYEEIENTEAKENFVIGYKGQNLELIVRYYEGKKSFNNLIPIGGKVQCHKDTTTEEINEICLLPIDIDTTNLNTDIKNTIRKTNGSLTDFSENIEFRQLESVGGELDLRNAKSIELNCLKSVQGKLHCNKAIRLKLDFLESIEGDLNCEDATIIQLNQLQSIAGSFSCSSATVIDLDSLQSIDGNFTNYKAENIDFPSLRFVKKYLVTYANNSIKLNALQSVGYFHGNRAKIVELCSLRFIEDNFDCTNAVNIKVHSLESVGGNMYCKSVKSIELDSLKIVKGDISANNAMTGNLESLNECVTLTLPIGSQIQLPQERNFRVNYVEY